MPDPKQPADFDLSAEELRADQAPGIYVRPDLTLVVEPDTRPSDGAAARGDDDVVEDADGDVPSDL